jgi:tRNA(Ile)-lysidine synthase
LSLDSQAGDALALLAPHRGLLLAVSGGPDSVALMLLCAKWPERGRHDVAVATVDHGLRPESRAEAEEVGEWARALGFAHHILTWEGEKPATRIQERARTARYELLADCARRSGASAVVTAHHADDQAETILFRLTRGSGVAGLAGMRKQAQCGRLMILRPLLEWPKAALVEICNRAAQPYFSDPSNDDEAYARTRLRKLAPALAAQGLDRDALLRLGERASRADGALEFCAAEARSRALLESESHGARFDPGVLRALPLELLQRLIASEIARLAPRASLRLDRLERAAGRLSEALRSGVKLRLTLANCLLEAGPRGVALRPAPPRRSGRGAQAGGP